MDLTVRSSHSISSIVAFVDDLILWTTDFAPLADSHTVEEIAHCSTGRFVVGEVCLEYQLENALAVF